MGLALKSFSGTRRSTGIQQARGLCAEANVRGNRVAGQKLPRVHARTAPPPPLSPPDGSPPRSRLLLPIIKPAHPTVNDPAKRAFLAFIADRRSKGGCSPET